MKLKKQIITIIESYKNKKNVDEFTKYKRQQGRNTFTKAPMTPKLVSLKYSNGLDLLVVLRKGYRYNGI